MVNLGGVMVRLETYTAHIEGLTLGVLHKNFKQASHTSVPMTECSKICALREEHMLWYPRLHEKSTSLAVLT